MGLELETRVSLNRILISKRNFIIVRDDCSIFKVLRYNKLNGTLVNAYIEDRFELAKYRGFCLDSGSKSFFMSGLVRKLPRILDAIKDIRK